MAEGKRWKLTIELDAGDDLVPLALGVLVGVALREAPTLTRAFGKATATRLEQISLALHRAWYEREEISAEGSDGR